MAFLGRSSCWIRHTHELRRYIRIPIRVPLRANAESTPTSNQGVLEAGHGAGACCPFEGEIPWELNPRSRAGGL